MDEGGRDGGRAARWVDGWMGSLAGGTPSLFFFALLMISFFFSSGRRWRVGLVLRLAAGGVCKMKDKKKVWVVAAGEACRTCRRASIDCGEGGYGGTSGVTHSGTESLYHLSVPVRLGGAGKGNKQTL